MIGTHLIRPETAAAIARIHRVNAVAFERDGEANLVDALRSADALTVSLVAELDGEIIGHVAFSPVTIERAPEDRTFVGLAPVAVLPSHQRQGVAAQLIRQGLADCAGRGCSAAVVLGEPAYYARFGFRPAADNDLRCEYDVPAEYFMALELRPGGLHDCRGLVRYHPAFAAV